MPRKVNKEAPGKNVRSAVGVRPTPSSPRLAILALAAAVLVTYAGSLNCPFVFDDSNDIVGNASHPPPVAARGRVPCPRRRCNGLAIPARGESLVRSGLCARRPEHAALSPDKPGDPRACRTWPCSGLSAARSCCRGSATVSARHPLPWRWRWHCSGRVHPLQTESVTYITQRYESMMGLFYLRGGLRPHPLRRLDTSLSLGRGDGGGRAACRWAPRKWPSRCRS